jgi:hypothetical protein
MIETQIGIIPRTICSGRNKKFFDLVTIRSSPQKKNLLSLIFYLKQSLGRQTDIHVVDEGCTRK